MPVIVSGGTGVAVIINRDQNTAVVRANTQAVRVAQRTSVTTVTAVAQTVGVSTPGVQGPRGEPGGTTVGYTAAAALGGHRLVRSTAAGTVGYADSSVVTHGDDTIGMTTTAADAGAEVQVQSNNEITFNGWTWAAGEPVFLGTDGLPTQTVPTAESGAAFAQVVGHATSSTSLYLSIEPPIYLD